MMKAAKGIVHALILLDMVVWPAVQCATCPSQGQKSVLTRQLWGKSDLEKSSTLGVEAVYVS